MIERRLFNIVFSKEWGRQMRFITGPRQSGKTTLAKLKLKEEHSEKLYYLWDLRSVRNRYKDNELFFTADQISTGNEHPWVCFDEIHKMPRWKNILKGIYDTSSGQYNFIITGSAPMCSRKCRSRCRNKLSNSWARSASSPDPAKLRQSKCWDNRV